MACCSSEPKQASRDRHEGTLPDGRRYQRPRHVPAPSWSRTRRVAAAPRRGADRPLSDARLGPCDASGGNAAIPGRRRAQRQDRLLRVFQLSRLAADQGRARGARQRFHPARDSSTAVQLARARDRVRDSPGLPGCRHRFAAVVAVGGRLAHRQVPSRRGPDGRHSPGRESRAWNGGMGASQQAGTNVADPERGPGDRTGQGCQPGTGFARVAGGSARGHFGDPGRTQRRTASRQPGRLIRCAHTRRARAPRRAPPSSRTTPTAGPPPTSATGLSASTTERSQTMRSATSGGNPPVATGPQLVGVIRISDLP